tara:strand:- start:180 stop:647 length:468 start_codon:yes stop_codon:yes gene_type:complete
MESRNKNVDLLTKIFDKKISEKIEGGILGFAESYSESQGTPFLLDSIYQEKFNEILCLLESNKNLVNLIKEGEIKPEEIAFKKAHELNPDKYEKINKKKEFEEKNKKDKPTTDLFQCPKCKKRRCTVSEKQTRRGDEPATSFIDCLECGHSWRVG